MATTMLAGSELLVSAKSREVQRGMAAEMAADRIATVRHFLAAAHLDLVLFKDYLEAGNEELAIRSGLSAVSCFWRAGDQQQAAAAAAELSESFPLRNEEIQQVLDELRGIATN